MDRALTMVPQGMGHLGVVPPLPGQLLGEEEVCPGVDRHIQQHCQQGVLSGLGDLPLQVKEPVEAVGEVLGQIGAGGAVYRLPWRDVAAQQREGHRQAKGEEGVDQHKGQSCLLQAGEESAP